MCVLCYTPFTAIGEVSVFGGPFVAAAVIRMRARLGLASPAADDQEGLDPDRTHASETHTTHAAAPAVMNASG